MKLAKRIAQNLQKESPQSAADRMIKEARQCIKTLGSDVPNPHQALKDLTDLVNRLSYPKDENDLVEWEDEINALLFNHGIKTQVRAYEPRHIDYHKDQHAAGNDPRTRSAQRHWEMPADLKADLLRPDYGDTFHTGEDVVRMIEEEDFKGAIRRLTNCIRLHHDCNNWRKAAILEGLRGQVQELADKWGMTNKGS